MPSKCLATLVPASASASFEAPDWTVLGLVLAIVGSFLVGNAVLFRNPRAMIAERFGVAEPNLRRIRELVFHRVQMTLGFGFLVAGFAAQLYGRAHPGAAGASGGGSSIVQWVGIVVVGAVALELAGWWWSAHSLRRHVRGFLRSQAIDLEADAALAREIGELFGVEPQRDDTVQAYVARLRQTLGTAAPPRAAQRATDVERRAALVARAPAEETDAAFEDT